VHTDQRAAESAAAVQAKAYTVGKNIVFGRGESPSSNPKLLAHELTHTIQQVGGASLRRKPTSAFENRKGASRFGTIASSFASSGEPDDFRGGGGESGGGGATGSYETLDDVAQSTKPFVCFMNDANEVQCVPFDEEIIVQVQRNSAVVAAQGTGTQSTSKKKLADPPKMKSDTTAKTTAGSEDRADDSSFASKPGFGESLIPIWGSAREAAHAFKQGHWGWGIIHSGLAISDVFLVKSAITAAGKVILKAGATAVVKEGGVIAAKEVTEIAAKESLESGAKQTGKIAAEEIAAKELAEIGSASLAKRIAWLRRMSPSAALRAKYAGKRFDPLYKGVFAEGLEADHIVPFDRIIKMLGFDKLTVEQQLRVLNYERNFEGISGVINASRKNKTFKAWDEAGGHFLHGRPENRKFLQELISREESLAVELQDMILNFSKP
jgi:hypothetical protein